MGEMIADVREALPNILVAVLLLVVGWPVAIALRYLTRQAVAGGLRRLGRGTSIEAVLEGTDVRGTVGSVVGGFVFWVVLTFFLAGAVERLGLPALSSLLAMVAQYLPHVLAAVLLVLGGVILGKLAGRAVTAAATSAGVARAPALGQVVQAALVLVGAIVGLEQLGVRGQLFVIIVAVVVGTFLGGAGLAFGLGARTTVGNILAAYYAAQAYRPGQRVRIGAIEGRIVTTTATSVMISTPAGRVAVPASKFSEEPSILLTEEG